MGVASYRDLVAWQRAMDLVEAVYRATARFPRDEIYGLTNQLRRCVVSVPSNLAEGQGRGEGPDFVRFVKIARGSVQEVETQIYVAHRLGYVDDMCRDNLLGLTTEVCRLIAGLLRALLCRSGRS